MGHVLTLGGGSCGVQEFLYWDISYKRTCLAVWSSPVDNDKPQMHFHNAALLLQSAGEGCSGKSSEAVLGKSGLYYLVPL